MACVNWQLKVIKDADRAKYDISKKRCAIKKAAHLPDEQPFLRLVFLLRNFVLMQQE